MMRRPGMNAQQGFTLVSAIFIMIIASIMSVFIISTSVTQQMTSTYTLQGVRANKAARSGLEWGVRRALFDDQWAAICTGADNGFVVDGFNVTVTCTFVQHTENGTSFCVFQMSSLATFGNYGGADFVQRRLQLVFSDNRADPISNC